MVDRENAADKKLDPEMKGWLYKWTNYIRGYQKRWFVLSNGLLSYYRNQAEMLHTCRGDIRMHGALIHTEDSCNFVISNGGTQTFHLRATSEMERQKWVTALELAKTKAVRPSESEDDDEISEQALVEAASSMRVLSSKLEDLKTCYELIVRHASSLQKALTEVEDTNGESSRAKAVGERATLFRISSNAMVNACDDFVQLSSGCTKKWLRLVQHEREQRQRLEEMVETLARQHSHLEEEAKVQMRGSDVSHIVSQIGRTNGASKNGQAATITSEDEDECEFEDAIEQFSEEIFLSSQRRPSLSDISQSSEGDANYSENPTEEDAASHQNAVQVIVRKEKGGAHGDDHLDAAHKEPHSWTRASVPSIDAGTPKKRRKRVPDKPSYQLNLWSIMKNCIGKELSKIPMPVNFSEPLSFLQRLTEDFEYSELLDIAAQCSDPLEQLTYVAAWTVSSYATTAVRTAKPFNPLLGETFECDCTAEMGWKAISEQVSHHPPIVAQHCQSEHGWESLQEFKMSSKFRGKYLQVIPLGIAHLRFKESGNHYTFRKVSTTVHNIIVGKLWLDNHGEMEIINHKTGDKGCLKFIPYSYFSRDTPKKVTGYVVDSENTLKWFLTGTWDDKMEAARVTSQGTRNGKPVCETDPPRLLWKRNPINPESEKYYNFTEFACQLNEMESGTAPTDSRLRPDQRLMEEGKWDEANDVKVRLEEKQRAVRRQREAEAEAAAAQGLEYSPYQPLWFRQEHDETTNEPLYIYKGGYWEAKKKQSWTMCMDIF